MSDKLNNKELDKVNGGDGGFKYGYVIKYKCEALNIDDMVICDCRTYSNYNTAYTAMKYKEDAITDKYRPNQVTFYYENITSGREDFPGKRKY